MKSVIVQGLPAVMVFGFLFFCAGCASVSTKDGSRTQHNPVIEKHPETQVITNGQTAHFSIDVSAKLVSSRPRFQWFRNGVELSERTSDSEERRGIRGVRTSQLSIENVRPEDVGFYECAVEFTEHGERVVTMSEAAELLVAQQGSLTVFGTPIAASGIGTECPPPYVGYVNYRKSIYPYGWLLSNVTAPGRASDPSGRADTVVRYFGSPLSNTGCGPLGQPVPVPASTCAFRFTIYFTRLPLPSGPYPIRLDGFAP